MTTRAGTIGLLDGILLTLIMYLIKGVGSFAPWNFLPIAVLFLLGGWLASRWSGSHEPLRRIILGAMAGALAGALFFCLWGAAASLTYQQALTPLAAILSRTLGMFGLLFSGGCLLGGLGAGLTCIHPPVQKDTFNKTDPQMAMNAAITALPASIFATALSAAVYPRLAQLFSDVQIERIPLLVSLLLVLLLQLALTLVTPHEARQAEHCTGMDEVKMAAFVGIAAAPVLAVLLALIAPGLFRYVWVLLLLLISAGMSAFSLRTLIVLILPRRATLPAPQGEGAHQHAVWFGSIASSIGSRLVTLCIGCGLMMVLPVCVTLVAPGLNLLANGLTGVSIPGSTLLCNSHRLFAWQMLVNGGLMLAAAGILSMIYIFYLNLGRWFASRS